MIATQWLYPTAISIALCLGSVKSTLRGVVVAMIFVSFRPNYPKWFTPHEYKEPSAVMRQANKSPQPILTTGGLNSILNGIDAICCNFEDSFYL